MRRRRRRRRRRVWMEGSNQYRQANGVLAL